jgi:hypothetical protein
MSFVDCIEAVIPMTKGTGYFPDISNLSATKMRKAIKLSVDTVTLKGYGFTHYRVTKDGLKSDSIKINDGSIEGYPTLRVRLYADFEKLKINFEPSEGDYAISYEVATPAGIGTCFSYKLEIPNVNEDDPFYFEDLNWNTEIRREGRDIMPPEDFTQKLAPKCIALL